LEGKHHLPVALHVDNRPMVGSCQIECDIEAAESGVVPISEVTARRIEVRSVGRSGLDLLTLSSSHFDPMYGPAVRCKWFRRAGGERSCINVSGL
jgi:hypothetical protein